MKSEKQIWSESKYKMATSSLTTRQELTVVWWSLFNRKKFRRWEEWFDKGMSGIAAYNTVIRETTK